MKKIETVAILKEIEEIKSKNLVKVIDFSTYQNLINEEYLEIENKYGSKLYKDIGLKSYNYMRITNEIDSRIATNLIISRINKSRFKFYNKNNNLIVLSKKFKDELDQLEINLNRLRYSERYEYRDNKDSKISYLIKGEKFGYYIEIDLIVEVIEIYLLDIKEGYFLIDKYSEGLEILKEIEEINLEGYYKGIGERKYSYGEIEKIKKELEIEEIKLEIGGMNEYRKRIEFSKYSVKEIYRWINKNIEKIERFISKYYKEVEERRLAFDLMKENN